MATYKDYYKVLGIERSADEQEIRRAFRKAAAKHHPDRNPGDASAEERFKEVNEAYTVLSDPEKRSVYNRFGSAGPAGGFPGGFQGGVHGGFPGATGFSGNLDPEDAAGFSDFFRSLFGAGMGADPFVSVAGSRFGAAAAAQPRSSQARLEVPLDRAFHGGPMSVQIDGRALEIQIPAGVRDGSKLRLRGQAPGGGDLLLSVRHAPHPRLRLDGTTLHLNADVPDYVAALGGQVRVSTIDGDVELSIPAGTSSGRKLRLRGRGWPGASASEGRGDLVVEVRIRVPLHLSDAQREAYAQLQALADPASEAD
jgi:curved DNA-binding protein